MAQNNYNVVEKSLEESHAKLETLEDENKRLRKVESELLRYKAKLPAIEHYLKLIPKLAE